MTSDAAVARSMVMVRMNMNPCSGSDCNRFVRGVMSILDDG
jgi:hypothetical protein